MARKPTKEVKTASTATRQTSRQKAEPAAATKRRAKAVAEEPVAKPRAKQRVATATKTVSKATPKAAPKKVAASVAAKPVRKTAVKAVAPKAVAKTPRAAKSVAKPAGRKQAVVTKLSAVEKLRITQETRKQKRLDRSSPAGRTHASAVHDVGQGIRQGTAAGKSSVIGKIGSRSMGFEMPGEGLGAGIFIVGPPDNAEFQMRGTVRIPDFHDCDVMAMLVADRSRRWAE